MDAAAFLRAAEALPATEDPRAVLGPRGALVLAPHPDDESIGCGGLVAAAVAAGLPVRVVIMSDGSGSHPGLPPARVQAVREAEALAATAALGLGPEAVHFLRLRDTAVPGEGPEFEAAVAAVLALAVPPPSALLCTWKHDPHRDHQASSAMAEAVVRRLPGTRLLAYPVWGWGYACPLRGFPLGTPPELPGPPRGHRFEIGPVLEAKRRAIAAHRSQHSDRLGDPTAFQLLPEMLALAERDYEILLDETP
ncbi:PIG-L deacetylase family protein [Paracraurococcus lichenis]|uniref:PIG-L family deacetylase n=1 Tax=Paracraurococcus lichenis TaxID=3064888 RepID=A0ABT9DZY6_9PROT|nr:PIG-L family deacetylase [Paracraurococcus sp. LOR1-02]MDO9709477.1 PIG-L family deacetylase [Paracraurococcus sp. LOR1-02]